MRLRTFLLPGLVFCFLLLSCQPGNKQRLKDGPRRIEILFLGHNSQHHDAARFMPLLTSELAAEGINFTYTDDPADLNPETLSYYDGLALYANYETISPEQEAALTDFVEGGKGFIPIHCASFCFQNSDAYIHLVGGQFQKHDTATFVATIVAKDHPAMQGVHEFSTWDETYIHDKLSDDRTVLMERVDGDHHEPWTWVKQQGKGRVFYTAYGHDERTWSNPGFHQLIKQGILWAVGDKVRAQWESFAKDIPTLTYREMANIPNYEQRNPPPKYQEPLSPTESAKLIQVPSGFDLELFASEPDIINPIAMDWDEKGRLWVIETVDYPNTVRDDNSVGDDRIKICEDTDGDGKADKFTIFADGLNIPTSLVFVNGGIIVSQAPQFLFLKDTDGDDRADVRKVIIDGWGTFDTHAGPSNLKYGLDNHIWGVVGYSGFEGTIAGTPRKFRQGVYRFTPDVGTFEFMTGTSNNTWGLGFTEDNNVFASTANNTHSVYMGISDVAAADVEGITISSPKIDGHYAMHPITDKVRQVDVFGGFTAASGHNFYTARDYPERFWNRIAFVAEPTGHLVHMARIEKKGAGFVEKDGWNLFASADEWVAPVEAKVGPDGAVWVLDWYNFIVQHNPTPTPDRGGYQAVNGAGNAYENPLRDKTHGRVWRVVYREAESRPMKPLSRDDPDALVDALTNNNYFWRITAQRLLVESENTDVLPRLYSLIEDESTNAHGENYAAVHALWVLEGLDVVHPGSDAFKVAVQALKHPAPAVRKAAVQVLSETEWTETDILDSGILDDPDPHTRLAALVSLVKASPSSLLGKKLFELSNDNAVKQDPWLSKAVYVAATRHRQGFIDAFTSVHPDFSVSKTQTQREASNYDDSEWPTLSLPQTFEAAGLNMDGVVWFRKTVDIPAGLHASKARLSLGPIDDADETWVNGRKIGSMDQYAAPREYDIPSGVLEPGVNIIAIRVTDTGSRGGLYGTADDMFISAGNRKVALAGPWKYEVEKNFSAADTATFSGTSIGELFVATYKDKPTSTPPSTPSGDGNIAAYEGKTVIRISALPNEMKYDIKEFTVEAGKPVVIIFKNPDFMQHNLVIAKPGSLKIVGQAADKLAPDPKAADLNYVPDIPEILFHTPLVDPQATRELEFTAPVQPGDYPYVCTFPGHWSIMNGVMKVTKSSRAL